MHGFVFFRAVSVFFFFFLCWAYVRPSCILFASYSLSFLYTQESVMLVL